MKRSWLSLALLMWIGVPAVAFAAAPTCTITANPTTIPFGGSVTVKWTSANATGGFITNIGTVPVSGQLNLIPTGTKPVTYKGTFSGSGGTANCSATVTIQLGSSGGGDGSTGETGGGGTIGSGGTVSGGSATGGTTGGNTSSGNNTVTNGTVTGGGTVTNGTVDGQTGSTGGGTVSPGTVSGGTVGGNTVSGPDVSSSFPTGLTNTSAANNKVDTGGIVPQACRDNAIVGCDLCTFGQLIQNIINWLLGISILLATIMFAWAGILYFTSIGNPGKITRAHDIFKSVALGFIIVLAGWLFVETLLNALTAKNFFSDIGGSWNKLECKANRLGIKGDISIGDWLKTSLPTLAVDPSAIPTNAQQTSGTYDPTTGMYFSNDASGSTGSSYSQAFPGASAYDCPSGYIPRSIAGDDATYMECINTTTGENEGISCKDGYTAKSDDSGICVSDATGRDALLNSSLLTSSTGSGTGGLRGTEQWRSDLEEACARNGLNNCALAQAVMAAESGGRSTLVGPTKDYGLMQVTLDVARRLDPSLAGMSDSQIAQKLTSDPAYNMDLGVRELTECVNRFGSGTDNAIACYNGGPGSIRQSTSCPGMSVWACPVNSGYAVTRNYVPTVQRYYSQIH
jgi:hypothetical protein